MTLLGEITVLGCMLSICSIILAVAIVGIKRATGPQNWKGGSDEGSTEWQQLQRSKGNDGVESGPNRQEHGEDWDRIAD